MYEVIGYYIYIVTTCIHVHMYNVICCCNIILMLYYSETSLIQHSMGPENNVRLGGCRIMECLLTYFNMVTVPH